MVENGENKMNRYNEQWENSNKSKVKGNETYVPEAPVEGKKKKEETKNVGWNLKLRYQKKTKDRYGAWTARDNSGVQDLLQ